MRRTLSRRGQWARAIANVVFAVLALPLAVSRMQEGNLIGAAFLVGCSGLLTWASINRWRTLRGEAVPPGTKRLQGAVIGLFLGVTAILLMIESFLGHSFRHQVGSVGANVLGAFWAIWAIGLFLMAWMVWTGRTRVPADRGGEP